MTVSHQPQQQLAPDVVDVRSYLRPIWRRRWIVVAIAILAAAATYVVTSREAKEYVASAHIYIPVADPASVVAGQAPAPPSAQNLADDAELITSQSYTQSVYARLKQPVSATSSVVATPQSGSSFIVITATSRSATLAEELANTYPLVFIASRKSAVASEAEGLARADRVTLHTLPHSSSGTAARAALLSALYQLDADAGNPSPDAELVDPAGVPTAAASPKPRRDTLFGFIAGLVLAIVVVFGLELLDRRLTLVSTVESLYGRPVLAVLPHVGDPAPVVEGRVSIGAELVEAVRTLMVNLDIERSENVSRVILVTSALPGEGKSTVTRGLALAYAEAGRHVLVVDADLRRPIMNTSFGLPAGPGLAELLRGEMRLAELVRDTGLTRSGHGTSNGKTAGSSVETLRTPGTLSVLTHGENVSNPVALLSSPAWEAGLATAAATYDVVLIDSAPVLTVADTVPLLEHADMVLLVARLGMTTRDSAARISRLFRRLPNANLVGLVANDMHSQLFDEGYGTYYGDYYRPDSTNGHRAPGRVRRLIRS